MESAKSRLVIDAHDGIRRIRNGPQSLGGFIAACAGHIAYLKQSRVKSKVHGFQSPTVALQPLMMNDKLFRAADERNALETVFEKMGNQGSNTGGIIHFHVCVINTIQRMLQANERNTLFREEAYPPVM